MTVSQNSLPLPLLEMVDSSCGYPSPLWKKKHWIIIKVFFSPAVGRRYSTLQCPVHCEHQGFLFCLLTNLGILMVFDIFIGRLGYCSLYIYIRTSKNICSCLME
uniref:Uncharacterized protein n=1 Tax=Micrurus spixii TaxID=129469 RepID=A0A2D4MNI0_9SAUR